MNATKIRLSQKEEELVNNTDWILTKHAILKKARTLLEMLQEEQQQYIQTHKKNIAIEVLQTTAKISKGENYKELPYLILDYPRFFDKENIFTLRTMFWWGNFFSITLHLSGQHKKMFQEKILHHAAALKTFSICINTDPWEHDFEKTNYQSIGKMKKEIWKKTLLQKSFIKIAKSYPLKQWNSIPILVIKDYVKILEVLAS
jgi:hypothetical protein